MEPTGIFRFEMQTSDHFGFSDSFIIVGNPTLEKIATVFEKYLQGESENQRPVNKIPRVLKMKFGGDMVTTDKELESQLEKSYRLNIGHFILPCTKSHLLKEACFEHWSYGYCDTQFEFDHLLEPLEQGSVLPDTEIEATVTFMNIGELPWPSKLRFNRTLSKEGQELESENYSLETSYPISKGSELKIPLSFKTPSIPGEYYCQKIRLLTQEGKNFGGRAKIYFHVRDQEHLTRLIDYSSAIRRADAEEAEYKSKKASRRIITTAVDSSAVTVKKMIPNKLVFASKTVTAVETAPVVKDSIHSQLKHDESMFDSYEAIPSIDDEGFGFCSKASYLPFRKDELYEDISGIFYPTTFVSKTFSFTNNGTMKWEPGLKLKYRFENPRTRQTMGEGIHHINLDENGLDRKGVLNDTVEFITPSEPGPYCMILKLITNSGIEFGDETIVDFHVITPPELSEVSEFSDMAQKLAHLRRCGFDRYDSLTALVDYENDTVLCQKMLFEQKNRKKEVTS